MEAGRGGGKGAPACQARVDVIRRTPRSVRSAPRKRQRRAGGGRSVGWATPSTGTTYRLACEQVGVGGPIAQGDAGQEPEAALPPRAGERHFLDTSSSCSSRRKNTREHTRDHTRGDPRSYSRWPEMARDDSRLPEIAPRLPRDCRSETSCATSCCARQPPPSEPSRSCGPTWEASPKRTHRCGVCA